MSALVGASRQQPGLHASSERPRLLFLCQTLPFPPDGGVNIRSYNILRLLARSFDVTALCFFRKGSRPSAQSVQESVAALREFAQVDAFPIPQEHNRVRFVLDHVASVLTGKAYTRYAYASTAFGRRLRELLASRRFDLVHVDSLDLSGYLPLLRGLPVACTHHNIESALLRSRARVESTRWRERYMLRQARLTEKEERQWCSRVNLNLAVSREDATVLRRIVPAVRLSVVPNGVDTAKFTPGTGAGSGTIFVGGYGWFPNRDGMSFFSSDILPRLRALGEPQQLTWVGRCPPEVRQEYAHVHGITATGYVDDVRPFIEDAACFIVPLRSGGGTRLKILDAWAMGKAVVSTSVGCEGLLAEDGRNILIRDDAAGFAEAVHAVLRDEQLRSRLGRAARDTVVEHYDWETVGGALVEEYLDLVQNPLQVSRP